MGGTAGDLHIQVEHAGGAVDEAADAAGGVKNITHAGLDLGHVQRLGAVKAGLLADGEHHLNAGQGRSGGQDLPQALQNGAHAGDVISGQDGGAVRVQHAVLFHRLDAKAVGDAVHMGTEEQRAFQLTLPHGDDVAALAAEGLTGVIPGDGEAQGLHLLRQLVGNGVFLAGSRVCGQQLDQLVIHSFVFHGFPSSGFGISRGTCFK